MTRFDEFLSLHAPGRPLLLANAWDIGSAKALAFLGYAAVATTSAGYAATLGRNDGGVSRDDALSHAAAMAAAVSVPVNADLENGYAADPESAAETYAAAAESGIAGASIEDYDPDEKAVYPIDEAAARVAAAAAAAHDGPQKMLLVGRAENHIRGITDLDDTIARLRAYQDAGADVLYAPGIVDAADIERVVSAVERPVNVLALPGVPNVATLAQLGVARVSVGSAFSLVSYGALAAAAKELLDQGTYGFWSTAAGASAVRGAFDE
ncbi:isocitrate lyase/phosphoenolpyruvate mutase family protein [Tsukamurella sp. 8F]|uniref:isocitrate lyase/PEP mutase family protein n=1 Tax=unclassified Tsukamurella TaxID=2633480 RepID=UPI0023B8AA5E|nr:MULTISPECIES: isocitrate lyase/phosphoenolpyruvate mutase family protein [unclassified Tsukamurella]MDF0530195.1 isocitrate lyase/phosphoenolpyruvate mutase family protein [Tsukamurella sp. 8J]MDF0586512.1 isocitrate lyase/phosphoenolpyruvate mutase family protein [Tsukamurella sp. 8F]